MCRQNRPRSDAAACLSLSHQLIEMSTHSNLKLWFQEFIYSQNICTDEGSILKIVVTSTKTSGPSFSKHC